MGCNCKNKNGVEDIDSNGSVNGIPNATNETNFSKIVKYTVKSLVFLLVLALFPIISVFIIWFIFKTIVLNKQIDMKPMISFVGRKLKDNVNEEEDYEDLTDANPDDYEVLEVEELNRSK